MLEGIQSDQDWLRVAFYLSRGPNRQFCCHLCDCIQWVSTKHVHIHNDANNLYTKFGPCEAARPSLIWSTCLCATSYGALPKNQWCFDVLKKLEPRIVTTAEFIQLHGLSPLCRVCGFDPERTLPLNFQKQAVAIMIWKKKLATANGLGLYPDYMHIVHLACATDSISSILLDLVEEPNIGINGGTRDQKLETLWHNYRSWAESAGN